MAVAIMREYPEDYSTGFTQIPNAVLRRSDLSEGARLTYAVLLSYAWKSESCFPSQETLAADLGVTDRSVRHRLTELSNAGLIEAKKRTFSGPNTYRLLCPGPPSDNPEADFHNGSYPEAGFHIKEGQSGNVVPLNPEAGFRSIRKPASTEEYSVKKTQVKKTQPGSRGLLPPTDITPNMFSEHLAEESFERALARQVAETLSLSGSPSQVESIEVAIRQNPDLPHLDYAVQLRAKHEFLGKPIGAHSYQAWVNNVLDPVKKTEKPSEKPQLLNPSAASGMAYPPGLTTWEKLCLEFELRNSQQMLKCRRNACPAFHGFQYVGEQVLSEKTIISLRWTPPPGDQYLIEEWSQIIPYTAQINGFPPVEVAWVAS